MREDGWLNLSVVPEIPHFGDVPDDTDAYCDDAAEAVAEEE